MIIELIKQSLLWLRLPAGLALPFAINARSKGDDFAYQMWISITLAGALAVGLRFIGVHMFEQRISIFYVWAFAACFAVGLVAGFGWLRKWPSLKDKISLRISSICVFPSLSFRFSPAPAPAKPGRFRMLTGMAAGKRVEF